jgi:hypothetical protein
VASFAEYRKGDGGDGLNVSGLGFVYGIPVFLIGASLKYAEIEPVPIYSGANVNSIFEDKATETIKKIKQDVTRHRLDIYLLVLLRSTVYFMIRWR